MLRHGVAFNAGRAYLYSCTTGALLAELESPFPIEYGRFGNAVVGVDEQDGDGHADVLVGTPSEHDGASEAGRAYLYSSGIDLMSELSGAS